MKRKIFLILLILVITYVYKVNEQEIIIPDSAIRLRVIPNSNSPLDTNIKEKVKGYLENDVFKLTYDVDNISDARKIINDNIPVIQKNIDTLFIDNDYDMTYDIKYGYNYFPKKIYKGISYEEGFYESLVISIGDGNGDNFWCVLFPNFCLIDEERKYEYKSYLGELIKKIF